MRRGLLYDENFKPQFSGHETFPLRYGWLKKTFDAVYELELAGKKSEAKDVFLDDEAIARFGVGKNMVGSMRHWAFACDVLEEDEDGDTVATDLGKMILSDEGLDPWLENASSLWAFHWSIATKSSKATYIWLFNYFNNTQFDRQTLVTLLSEFCTERRDWKDIADATIKRDIECLVRAYVNKPSKAENFTEDQIESPLAELGLIQPLNKNDTFQLRRGRHPSLGSGTFLYALIDFWQGFTSAGTLSLETITYEAGSPGRVLCLDESAVAERLYDIEQISRGSLVWSETAGLRQVITKRPIEKFRPLDFLKQDYSNSSRRRAA